MFSNLITNEIEFVIFYKTIHHLTPESHSRINRPLIHYVISIIFIFKRTSSSSSAFSNRVLSKVFLIDYLGVPSYCSASRSIVVAVNFRSASNIRDRNPTEEQFHHLRNQIFVANISINGLKLVQECGFESCYLKEKSSMKSSSRLNVAIIHPDLGIGGAERLIVDAAVELASYGHNIHVFTAHHDKKRCFEETLSGIFPVAVYGSFLPRHIFYRLHAVCAYLRCIFVALCVMFLWPSFDVILVDQVSVVIPLMKFKKSAKVVFYCHFPDLLLAQHTTALRRMYRKPIDFIEEITTGMADLILVNSKFTASTFAKTFKNLDARGIRPAVLYPAVNLDQFNEPNTMKLNFLSINRFERKKNIELAISAFANLHKIDQGVLHGVNLADVSLSIAGGYDKRLIENVEYLVELQNLAESEGVSDRVKFITSCSTAERNALLSECVCVLYTPQDEHFGIVPLEAMASWKPVIACNSGGPIETVINGETGFLCDANPQDFSLAMAKFLKDPQIAERMGREARKHVTESFSTKIFGQHLNRYLVDIARGKDE